MTPEVVFQLNLDPELPPEIQELAIRQGEDENTKYELIEQLRSLIIQNGKYDLHRTDDEYLSRFLRARFWKVEQSYQLLCNYYDFREKNSKLYENVSCEGLSALADDRLVTITPYRERNGCRILIVRAGPWNPSKITIEQAFQIIMIISEMGSMEPISQVAGGIAIIDLQGISMSHLRHLSPFIAQKALTLMETATPLRAVAVHVVNQNWIFNLGMNVFKPFMTASLRERLFIHGSDMSSLHKHIDPKCLPKRYGGVHEDHPYAKWLAGLRQDAKVRRQLEELGYKVDIPELNELNFF